MREAETYDEFDEFDEDPHPDDPDLTPAWFGGHHLPDDARRMGLTHHVPDGAILDFAGTLDPAKPLHKAAAWGMLVVFGLPVVFAVLRLRYVF